MLCYPTVPKGCGLHLQAQVQISYLRPESLNPTSLKLILQPRSAQADPEPPNPEPDKPYVPCHIAPKPLTPNPETLHPEP